MIHSEKADLRRKMLGLLQEAADSLKEKSRLIHNCLLALDTFQRAWRSERLMSFVSMPSEIDTTHFFSGRSMIVPCCAAEEIVPMRILSLDELEPTGNLRILEPKLAVQQDGSRQVLPEQIDVVLVPGLAFDPLGNRLGRGRGYYDRFLRRLPAGALTIGLALDTMIRNQIPYGENDYPVKMVVTEIRVYGTEP